MKKLLNRCKALVAIVSVFAILAVSMFSVLSGVSFVALAKDGTASVFTGKIVEVTLLDTSAPNSKSNPYIIENAGQMFALSRGECTYNGNVINTEGAYFKVADGVSAFYMNGGEAVADLADANAVKEHFEANAGSYNKYWSNYNGAFKGTFDGNGVTVYGLLSDGGSGGLFPYVAGTATIKNVAVKNSYIVGGSSGISGGIVGSANCGAISSITLENCAVVNNYIKGTRPDAGGGGLCGFLYNTSIGKSPTIYATNCLVADNIILGKEDTADSVSAGIGAAFGAGDHKIENCVFLGIIPFNPSNWHAKQPSKYVNSYTDADLSVAETSYSAGTLSQITAEQLKGEAGVQMLSSFDFKSVWFASEGIPTLRVLHTITGTAAGVDGHTNEKDTCCDVDGIDVGVVPHTYTDENKCSICDYIFPCINGHTFTDIPAVDATEEHAGNIAYKSCSACQKNYAPDAALDAPISSALESVIIPQILPYDEWDGTWDEYFWMNNEGDGSPATPFIIETAEQLAAVATARLKYNDEKPMSEGFDVSKYTISGGSLDTTGLFFKVKDGKTSFYMNGGSAVAEMTDVADVKAYFETTPGQNWWLGSTFRGNFNGNGATVYGLYADKDSSGLFPMLGPNTVIKNITVKNSYIKAAASSVVDNGFSGGIFGQVVWYNGINNMASVTVRNSAVVNTYIYSQNAADAGAIGGHIRELKLKVKNFLAYGNDISSKSGNVAGLIGEGWGSTDEIVDSVLIGVAPYSLGADVSRNYGKSFKNVYTDVDLTAGENAVSVREEGYKYNESQLKKLDTDQMLGESAKENMSTLDWEKMWQIDSDGVPVPRLLTIKDYATGNAWTGEIAEEFPAGEGTKGNPYIINTPEYLALMLKTDSENLYFELTTDIMINDTSVENWQDSAKQWFTSDDIETFKGTLNGNGYTVSGLYFDKVAANASAGLIAVKGSGDVTNINIADSYLTGNDGATLGALIGSVEDNAARPIVVQGATVENTVVIDGAVNAGGIVGKGGNSVLRISNCKSGADIKATGTKGGIIAVSSVGTTVKNSISLGTAPIGDATTGNIKDVYTNTRTEVDGVTVLTDEQMLGDSAVSNMPALDFEEIWTTVADGYPALAGVISNANGIKGEIWTGEIATEFEGGDGTAENPYLIATGEQLASCVVNNRDNTHYKLVADIYLNDVDSPLWEDKIGCNEWYVSKQYNGKPAARWAALNGGSFDGDGYVIYGLYYNRAELEENFAFCGLFPTLNGNSKIMNLGISNAYLDCSHNSGSGSDYIGAITGYVEDWDGYDYDNDSSNGTTLPSRDAAASKAYTGTPEYQAQMPTISNCFVDHTCYISGRLVGGFVGGGNGTVKVENCIFTGTLSGPDKNTTAGIIGQDMSNGSYFINCISFPQTCDRPLGGASNNDWRMTDQDFVTTAENMYYFSMYRVFNSVTKISKPTQRIGEEAMKAMSGLDWAGNTEDGTEDLWRVVENGTPMLTIFDKHRDDADKFSDKAFMAPDVTVNLVTGTTEVQYKPLVGRMYSKMELPTPVRPGYEFTGWYPHSNLSVEYPYDYFPPRTLNLYAGWKAIGIICDFENYTNTVWDYDDTRWVFNKPGAADGYKNEYVRNGSKSMHLLDTSSEAADVLLNYEDMLEVGKSYTMTFWVTTDKENNPATQLSLVHNSEPVYLDTGIALEKMVVVEGLTAGKWKEYTYTFTAQTKWVSFRADGNSSLYFDDILIVPIENTVSNGNLIYLGTGGADGSVIAPNTSDNAISIAAVVAVIMACAIIVVVSRKNLVEVIED